MSIFRKSKFANFGKVKKSTDALVDAAIDRQNSWQARLRRRGRAMLEFFGAKPKQKNLVAAKPAPKAENSEKKVSVWRAFWFPILCAIIVILLILWALFHNFATSNRVPDPTTRQIEVVDESAVPTFDVVRIEPEGAMVIASRWLPNSVVSVSIDGKIVATESTDKNGEFVYSPSGKFAAGNYVIQLYGVDSDNAVSDKVFVYVSPKGFENSVSLLITKHGSKLLQSPTLTDGDLVVQKIDYLENGRIVVQGRAMPRLRVSLSLDGEYLGYAITSDHRNFGLGYDIKPLEAGTPHKLTVRLHDGDGLTVERFVHEFTMPKVLPGDATFYTVRRDDCLWFIARNFLGMGHRYSVIVGANEIKDPNLIYPKQVLKIPVKKNGK